MGYRVLLIDDSQLIRSMLGEMLAKLGHEVVAQANSVATALKAYGDSKPDLVLLDVSLPDGDGLSLLKDIRGLDPKARVILVTAIHQKKIKDAGASGFLPKPFNLKELSAVLEKVGPLPS